MSNKGQGNDKFYLVNLMNSQNVETLFHITAKPKKRVAANTFKNMVAKE